MDTKKGLPRSIPHKPRISQAQSLRSSGPVVPNEGSKGSRAVKLYHNPPIPSPIPSKIGALGLDDTEKEYQAMSPAVGNFVTDLVEMARAMEELPRVQADLDRVSCQRNEAQAHSQQLEMNIIGYKDEITALHAKVRSLEVERDDASFRTLEAEDDIHTTLSSLETIEGVVAKLKLILDPPKPQPEPVVQPQAVDPTSVTQVPDYIKEPVWGDQNVGQSPLDAPQTASPEGQSESSPIVDGAQTTQANETIGAETQATASSDDLEPTKYDYYGNVREAWYEWNTRQAQRHAAS